jgi:hypothetical protein
MATYGVIGSPTYAVAIADLYSMLNVLPDNSANLISAQDVRDVVAGLFEGIESLGSSVSMIATSSVYYQNLNLTSVQVGGISYNDNFTGSSIQSVLDRLFYPYTPPVLSLTSTPSVLEFGNTTTAVVLGYSVSAGINNTLTSTLYGPVNPPQLVGSPLAFGITYGTVGGNSVLSNLTSIFTFSVDDTGVSTGGINSVTTSVSYSLKRFWGTLPSASPLVTASSSTFSYSDVNTLSSELNSDYSQSRHIMTNSDYVVFIWPTNTIDLQGFPPKVFINGLSNNDWSKTRDNVIFINQYGYTASYDVWRFNNLQGMFTSSYVITT